MKFPPLAIFMLLLVVLLIVVLFGKYIPEGFIAYGKATADMATVTMPGYNKSVYKLYDSLYFDATNGNMIELFGPASPTGTATSGTATTDTATTDTANITKMVLMPRTGSTVFTFQAPITTSIISDNLKESRLNPAYLSWSVPTSSTPLPDAQYQISYVPWGKDTLVHVYDMTQSKQVGLYTLMDGGSKTEDMYKPAQATVKPTATTADTDPFNGKVKTLPVYDPTKASNVFQLTANVFFDMKCGYLLVQNANSGLDVYSGNVDTAGVPIKAFTGVMTAMAANSTPSSRTSGSGATAPASPASPTVASTSTVPFLVMDSAKGNMILYKYLGDSAQRTLVVVFSLDGTNMLKIQYVGRFNPSSSSGVDVDPTGTGTPGPVSGPLPGPLPGPGPVSGPGPVPGPIATGQGTLDDVITAYYLNNFGIGQGTGQGTGQGQGTGLGPLGNNNYMLKSQIIPPVCPTCPSYSPTCTTCQGQGQGTGPGPGKGTGPSQGTEKGTEKDTDRSNNAIKGAASDTWSGVKTAGKDVKGAVGDVYGGVKEVGSDVKGAVGDAYGEVKELGSNVKGAVGDVFGGVKGAVGDVYGGIKGAVKDVYSGVKDVGGDVYSGAKRLGRGGGDEQGRNSRGTAGNWTGDLQGNMGYAGGNSTGSGVRYITSGASPMSYYGGVPDRGDSDFLPVTADFSRFGR